MDAEWTARPDAIVSGESCAEREFADMAGESSVLAFRVAWSVLRDRADAEEIAQEALLRAHRHFRRLRDPERFRAWLVRVTWRLALDRMRAARRRERREAEAGRAAIAAAGQSEVKVTRFPAPLNRCASSRSRFLPLMWKEIPASGRGNRLVQGVRTDLEQAPTRR